MVVVPNVVDVMDGQINGTQAKLHGISLTSHWAMRSASPMLQAPSPLTSQTTG